ncbi:alpha-1-antitrypsin homolog [Pholidichthys leucotaenia]
MCSTFSSYTFAVLLLAVSWADHGSQTSDNKLSGPNADFAFSLYKNLNAKAVPGKNIFYSPLGISTALSMLSTGARGDTHSQIFSTLGYRTLNQTQVNEAFGHLFQMLHNSQGGHCLNVGSTTVLRTGFSPLEKFLKAVKEVFNSEILNVDFNKSDEAAAEINRHIARKTQGKIKDMVTDLDPAMAMMLFNYVYFRGEWEMPFDPIDTRKARFSVNSTTKVEVDMMTKIGYFSFHYGNHTKVVTLPYKGSIFMMIVLPDKGKMKEVEAFITKDQLQHWQDSAFMRTIFLRMPKFSISDEASLDNSLTAMGIADAFSDKADFSGISEDIMLKLSKVSHQAVLSVDETGTEAAAATAGEITPMSLPERVIINRPFMVFILDDSTNSILFMGKINNPTA